MKPTLLTALAATLLTGPISAQAEDTFTNPILYSDFPDNDISPGPDGAFYFLSSNFHYSPGAPLLRSHDLINWEWVGHTVPRLTFGNGYDLPPPTVNDDGTVTPGERAYRGGTWASSMRYRPSDGLWYWIGCTNFWNTWVYTAPAPEGPWEQVAWLGNEECFYDNGLLVDDVPAAEGEEDALYVVYTWSGQSVVNVTQLAADGKSIVRTETVLTPADVGVDGLEGNRLYKINGTYYILNDHPGSTAYVWKSDSPWGPYEAKALADQVPGPVPGGGVPHQGSLVEAAPGEWYFMSFTWAYPGGRLPVLAPVVWGEDGFPTLVTNTSAEGAGSWGVSYPLPLPSQPLNYTWTSNSYDFTALTELPPAFEWNHNPDESSYALSAEACLTLSTATVTDDLYSARNTLTHRAYGEFPAATAWLNISKLADGDRAGLAVFRDRSSYIGVHKLPADNSTDSRLEVVTWFNATIDEYGGATLDLGAVTDRVEIPLDTESVWFRVGMDARADGTHLATFGYRVGAEEDGEFTALGGEYELYTGWAFFLGYRFALVNYATQALGGSVDVLRFATE
ncbi:hydrolase-like protein [Chaetomium sp. MPI-SDFR-AT-0129]|nr:hydrolase-like protein [Chaetomium sp. MPI-SDFR-AT-0129]